VCSVFDLIENAPRAHTGVCRDHRRDRRDETLLRPIARDQLRPQLLGELRDVAVHHSQPHLARTAAQRAAHQLEDPASGRGGPPRAASTSPGGRGVPSPGEAGRLLTPVTRPPLNRRAAASALAQVPESALDTTTAMTWSAARAASA